MCWVTVVDPRIEVDARGRVAGRDGRSGKIVLADAALMPDAAVRRFAPGGDRGDPRAVYIDIVQLDVSFVLLASRAAAKRCVVSVPLLWNDRA